MDSSLANKAVKGVREATASFCRFITANDTGKTGGNQSGFYIPKGSSELLFDTPGMKGENLTRDIQIDWQDEFHTYSTAKYYGNGTRNEYRLTKFGRNFPYLDEEYTGSLLVLCKLSSDLYKAYVLSTDSDIEGFYTQLELPPTFNNSIIPKMPVTPEAKLEALILEKSEELQTFPTTDQMARMARECREQLNAGKRAGDDADSLLEDWIGIEYKLYQAIENRFYSTVLAQPFGNMEKFVATANEVLNRRKSRAGKSLEHHLAAIFTRAGLVFQEQVVTEYHKRPDFIFPNGECYHNFAFPAEYLTMLGVKTSCKDRWRQILNEADRIDRKHLFTLQPSLSANQLAEMGQEGVQLVIPAKNLVNFPASSRGVLLTLHGFISETMAKQEHIPRRYLIS